VGQGEGHEEGDVMLTEFQRARVEEQIDEHVEAAYSLPANHPNVTMRVLPKSSVPEMDTAVCVGVRAELGVHGYNVALVATRLENHPNAGATLHITKRRSQ